MLSYVRVTSALRVSLLVAGSFMLAAVGGADAASALTVVIEQDGVTAPADKNGNVTLKRAPFSIVAMFAGEGVSLSASPDDRLMKLAKKHRLDEPFSNSFKAAVLDEDAGQTLNVSADPTESYSYYFYSGADNHAFSDAKQADGQIVGRLNISKVRLAKNVVSVGEFSGSDLYLVFATTQAAGRGAYKVAASDQLHIRFAQ